MPMCPGRRSWRHHQPAAAVSKTKRLNVYRHCTAQNVLFSRQQDEMCGQQRYCWTPGSTAAKEKPDKTATVILQTSWTLSAATIKKMKKLKIRHAEEEKRLIHILICVANRKKNRLNHSLMHRFVLEAGAPPLPSPPPPPPHRKKKEKSLSKFQCTYLLVRSKQSLFTAGCTDLPNRGEKGWKARTRFDATFMPHWTVPPGWKPHKCWQQGPSCVPTEAVPAKDTEKEESEPKSQWETQETTRQNHSNRKPAHDKIIVTGNQHKTKSQ